MEQLFEIIFTDFRSSKKNVNRLLSVGIFFALVGHFYVVEPYFQYKIQERNATEALDVKKEQLNQLTDNLNSIKDVSQEASKILNNIRKRIGNFPDHLRTVLPKIAQALRSGPTSQHLQIGAPSRFEEISLPPDIISFEAGVSWYIENWFNDAVNELKTKVVNPVLQLEHGQKRLEAFSLKEKTHEAIEKLRTHLKGVDPEFWHRYEGIGGKVEVASELQRTVEESFDPVVSEVSHLLKKTGNMRENQEENLNTIQEDLIKTQTRIKKLEFRINSLKSPLGPIPMGLTDLIILFPLLIVTLVVMLALAVRKSGQLYIVLWREVKKGKGDADFAVFQHYSDCWYLPPYASFTHPVLIFTWLAMITGIFVRAGLLVSGELELFTSLAGEVESLKHSIFAGAYIVGMVVIITCAWFSGKTLRLVLQELIKPSITCVHPDPNGK